MKKKKETLPKWRKRFRKSPSFWIVMELSEGYSSLPPEEIANRIVMFDNNYTGCPTIRFSTPFSGYTKVFASKEEALAFIEKKKKTEEYEDEEYEDEEGVSDKHRYHFYLYEWDPMINIYDRCRSTFNILGESVF
jgi:hypothetical protein